MKLKNPTTLRDTLYNLATDSGASDDYAQGVTVGVVGALVSCGMTFNEAWELAKQNMPANKRENYAPEVWKVD